MDSVTADLHILKTPEMSVQTIRIKSQLPPYILEEGFTSSSSTLVMLNKIRGLGNLE